PPQVGQARMSSRLILRAGVRLVRLARVMRVWAALGRKWSARVTALRLRDVGSDSRGVTMRFRARGLSRACPEPDEGSRGERSRISTWITPSHSYSIQNMSGTERWNLAYQGLYSYR